MMWLGCAGPADGIQRTASSERHSATSSSFEEDLLGPWRLVLAEWLLIQHVMFPP